MLAWLMGEARRRGLTGIALKDDRALDPERFRLARPGAEA